MNLSQEILEAAVIELAEEEKFKTLATQVIEETAGMSSTVEMAKHPAYQEIIKMGEPVIPLLLKDLLQNPLYWLTALREITQENPVKPEHKGKIKQMAQAWLNWGKEKGYSATRKSKVKSLH